MNADDLHGDFINFYKRSKNDVVSTDEIYFKVYMDLVDNNNNNKSLFI